MESSWYLWQTCDAPALRGFGVQYRNNVNYCYAFCWKSYRIFLDICDQIQKEWHKWFQNQNFYLCSFLTLRAENMDTQYSNSKVRRSRVLKFIPWMQLLRISDAKTPTQDLRNASVDPSTVHWSLIRNDLSGRVADYNMLKEQNKEKRQSYAKLHRN